MGAPWPGQRRAREPVGCEGAVGWPGSPKRCRSPARRWRRFPPPLPAPGPGPLGPIWFQSAFPATPEGLPRLARHKPPDKGASIAQTVPIWTCPHPLSLPSSTAAAWPPATGTPGPAPPRAALPGPVPAALRLLQLVSISQMCAAAAALSRGHGARCGARHGVVGLPQPHRHPRTPQLGPKLGPVGQRQLLGAGGWLQEGAGSSLPGGMPSPLQHTSLLLSPPDITPQQLPLGAGAP